MAQFKEVDGHEAVLFASFDGHSGNDVATYLSNHLFNNILHQEQYYLSILFIHSL